MKKVLKIEKMPTAPGIPKRSPIQVLTGPDVAWLPGVFWWKVNFYFVLFDGVHRWVKGLRYAMYGCGLGRIFMLAVFLWRSMINMLVEWLTFFFWLSPLGLGSVATSLQLWLPVPPLGVTGCLCRIGGTVQPFFYAFGEFFFFFSWGSRLWV